MAPSDLDATGIDAASAVFDRWLREHGFQYVRGRRGAMDRNGTRHGVALIDFLIIARPPRALAILFKHERNALTPRQEQLFRYMTAAGWKVSSVHNARDAIAEVVRTVCEGVYPSRVKPISGNGCGPS